MQHTLAAVLALCLAAGIAAAGMREGRAAFAERDFAGALREFAGPAASGNAEAEAMLGVMHALGLGTPRDPRRGFEFTRRAAGRGLPAAQARLAHFYETGTGIAAPDPVRAFVWYELAVRGGEADAVRDRERIKKFLTEIEIGHANTLIEDFANLLNR